jgi:hypothetical protein
MTTATPPPDPTEARTALRLLVEQRAEMESVLAGATARLSARGGGGLTGSLVDKEGYPRADIDLAQTRMDRHAVATLTNDLRGLMRRIEAGLQELHAAAAPAGETLPCRRLVGGLGFKEGYRGTLAEGDGRTEDTKQHQPASSDHLAHQAPAPAAHRLQHQGFGVTHLGGKDARVDSRSGLLGSILCDRPGLCQCRFRIGQHRSQPAAQPLPTRPAAAAPALRGLPTGASSRLLRLPNAGGVRQPEPYTPRPPAAPPPAPMEGARAPRLPLQHHSDAHKSRIATCEGFRVRDRAHEAVSPRPPSSLDAIVAPYAHVHVRRECLGVDPRSRAIFCRPVPNPNHDSQLSHRCMRAPSPPPPLCTNLSAVAVRWAARDAFPFPPLKRALRWGLSARFTVERAAVPRGGFAIVDEVTAGSPAALGGFVVGDLIVSFGDVSGGPLTQLASVLQASENREYQEDVLLCLFFFLFKNLVNCVL